MIHDKSRAFYIGASDTDKVVGNYNTASWRKWYLKKLGINRDYFSTKAMKVGNAFEGKILDTIQGVEKDGQIIIENLGLRVNYDGIVRTKIYEVKTYSSEAFKVSQTYWRQAQVEMFAYLKVFKVLPELVILAYKVTEDDYANYFSPIDPKRLSEHPVEYDEEFISEYLSKLGHLHKCIKKGVFP